MTVAREQLVSSVRLLCGELPDCPISEGGLPSNLIFEELCNVEASMLRDLDLSTANARVAKIEETITSDEMLIAETDFQSPSYVYLRLDTSSDLWFPVEIVEHSSLVKAGWDGVHAIAFSGSPVTAYLSWIPASSETIRIWYERSGTDDPVLADVSQSGYDEYLKLQTAAQCREYLKMEVGVVLKARLVKSERQWQKHANRGHQRGIGKKAPVFPRRRGYPFLDRTRFFVS